jgi:hypothetical protein
MLYYLYMRFGDHKKLYGIFSTMDKAKQAIQIFAQKYKELYIWDELSMCYENEYVQKTKYHFDKDVERFVSYFISDFDIVESHDIDDFDTKIVEDHDIFPDRR